MRIIFLYVASVCFTVYVAQAGFENIPDLNQYIYSIETHGSGWPGFEQYLELGYDVLPSLLFAFIPFNPVLILLAYPLFFWFVFLYFANRIGLLNSYGSILLMLSFIFSGTYINLTTNQTRSGAAIFLFGIFWQLRRFGFIEGFVLSLMHLPTSIIYLFGAFYKRLSSHFLVATSLVLIIVIYYFVINSRFSGYVVEPGSLAFDSSYLYRILFFNLLLLPLWIYKMEGVNFYILSSFVITLIGTINQQVAARILIILSFLLFVDYLLAYSRSKKCGLLILQLIFNFATLIGSSIINISA